MNELQIISNVTPAKIEFNKAELEQQINTFLEQYKDAAVTEETLKDDKKLVANLRKVQKAIDDERKKIKKSLTEGVTLFEADIKDLDSKFQVIIDNIDGQIKEFENAAKEEKRAKIQVFIDKAIDNHGLRAEYAERLTIKDSYLNATATLKSSETEINELAEQLGLEQDQYDKDVDTISEMVELNNKTFGVTMLANTYIRLIGVKSIPEIMLDINKDVQMSQAIKIEDSVKEQALSGSWNVDEVKPSIEPAPDAEKYVETYEVTGTEAQLEALEKYLDDNFSTWKVVE